MRQTRRAKRHGREAKDHAVPHAGGPPGTAWGQRDGRKLSVTRSTAGAPVWAAGKTAAKRRHEESTRRAPESRRRPALPFASDSPINPQSGTNFIITPTVYEAEAPGPGRAGRRHRRLVSPTRDARTGRFTDAGCAGVENACCKGDRGPRNDATAPHGHGQLAAGLAPGGGPLPPGPGAGCPGHPGWHEQRARSGAGGDTPDLACALPGLRGETEAGGGRTDDSEGRSGRPPGSARTPRGASTVPASLSMPAAVARREVTVNTPSSRNPDEETLCRGPRALRGGRLGGGHPPAPHACPTRRGQVPPKGPPCELQEPACDPGDRPARRRPRGSAHGDLAAGPALHSACELGGLPARSGVTAGPSGANPKAASTRTPLCSQNRAAPEVGSRPPSVEGQTEAQRARVPAWPEGWQQPRFPRPGKQPGPL